MTKAKFTYELIDKWLYLISAQCVVMENYTQKDQTIIYTRCINKLKRFFDYYDQVYEKVNQNIHSEEEIEARLEFLIQKLRNETIKNIMKEFDVELCTNIKDKERIINQYLLHNKKGENQQITKGTLIRFITELRLSEEHQEEHQYE